MRPAHAFIGALPRSPGVMASFRAFAPLSRTREPYEAPVRPRTTRCTSHVYLTEGWCGRVKFNAACVAGRPEGPKPQKRCKKGSSSRSYSHSRVHFFEPYGFSAFLPTRLSYGSRGCPEVILSEKIGGGCLCPVHTRNCSYLKQKLASVGDHVSRACGHALFLAGIVKLRRLDANSKAPLTLAVERATLPWPL